MGAKRDWLSGLAGGEWGRGRPRERAPHQLRVRRRRPCRGSRAGSFGDVNSRSAHGVRTRRETPRDCASPEKKKAFPFLAALVSPPPRSLPGLCIRIHSTNSSWLKLRFYPGLYPVARTLLGPSASPPLFPKCREPVSETATPTQRAGTKKSL